jgi:hypothetical protein
MAMEKKTWEEFQKAGLIWFVNRILHFFGWAIVLNCEDDGRIVEVYPARVTFRGFELDVEEQGYEKVACFMRDHAKELYDEVAYKEPK